MNFTKKFNRSKGITLIALVVTIIVLLILAGVSVAMLTGQNGILTQANNAKTSTANKSAEEKVKLAVMAARSQSEDASLDLEKLTAEVTTNYGGQVEGGAFPATVTIDGKSFTVDSDGNVELAGSKPQITNAKVTTDAAGKNAATSNTAEGTTLYITFGATLENGTITKVIDNDGNKEMTASNGIYSKAITKNGTYTFAITGTGENGDVTTNATVQVKEFENKIKPGTEISLKSTKGTTEKFYVLSYDESTQKAKALAKYNLMVGAICDSNGNKTGDVNTSAANYGLQDEKMKGWDRGRERKGTVAFSSSKYWSDTTKYPSQTTEHSSSYPWVYNTAETKCTISQYVESYKTLLGNTDKVSEVSLASYEDISALRSNNSNYTWLYSTSFWLGSANVASYFEVWYVATDNYSISSRSDSCSGSDAYGVRPVITIDMSKI